MLIQGVGIIYNHHFIIYEGIPYPKDMPSPREIHEKNEMVLEICLCESLPEFFPLEKLWLYENQVMVTRQMARMASGHID